MTSGVLETPRLRLEPWRDDHAALLARLAAQPEVMRHIAPGAPWSGLDARSAAVLQRRHWQERGFGWRTAVERATGEAVGVVAVSLVGTGHAGLDREEHEIGWWLDPRAWGRGLAREGAAAVRDEAFDRLGAPHVIARMHAANARSIAVAEAVGLTFSHRTTGRAGEPLVVHRLEAGDRPSRGVPA